MEEWVVKRYVGYLFSVFHNRVFVRSFQFSTLRKCQSNPMYFGSQSTRTRAYSVPKRITLNQTTEIWHSFDIFIPGNVFFHYFFADGLQYSSLVDKII